MIKRHTFLSAVIVLLFSYCKKDATPETPPSLKTDSVVLHVKGFAGMALNTFNIQTKSAWEITSSADWLTTDVSTGTGDTRIIVRASKSNGTTVGRSATLTIRVTGSTTVEPIVIDVLQEPLVISLSAPKFFGGTRSDDLYSAVRTKDGGFIMAGDVSSDGAGLTLKGAGDIWIMKTDAAGNLSWQTAIGGTFTERANKIIEMGDGGYAVAGFLTSLDGDIPVLNGKEAVIIRLDASGNIKWKKTWGGTLFDEPTALVETPDGGLIVTGTSASNDGDMEGLSKGKFDGWILSLDKDGNSRWQKVIGDTEDETPVSIIKTANNTYLLVGTSSSNTGEFAGTVASTSPHPFIREIDGDGNKLMQVNYSGLKYGKFSGVIQTADGGFLLTGTTSNTDGDFSSNHGGQDAWLLKVNQTGNKVWQKLLGGTSNDLALSAVAIEDGYLVTASSYSNNGDLSTNLGNNDIWVFNTDNNGNIQWQKTFGGTKSEYGYGIFYNADKTITILGNTDSNDGDCAGNPGGISPVMFKLTLQ